MAYDIYVGPVSRYLAGDWKTVGQVATEQMGATFKRIGPKESLLGRLFKSASDPYATWTSKVQGACRATGVEFPIWDDSATREYETDRPGWEGHTSFVACYAYSRQPNLKPPARTLNADTLEQDPAFIAEMRANGSVMLALFMGRYFLPGTFNHVMAAKYNNRDICYVGSLRLLDDVIGSVCHYYNFDRNKISTEALDQVAEHASFEEAVRYGTSIYAKLVDHALSSRLPLIYDY